MVDSVKSTRYLDTIFTSLCSIYGSKKTEWLSLTTWWPPWWLSFLTELSKIFVERQVLLSEYLCTHLKSICWNSNPHGDDIRRWLTTLWGFPDSSDGKESAWNAGDSGSIPRLGKSPGEGIGYPLQYSWTSLVAQTVSACNVRDLVIGLGRSPGWGHGNQVQYSCWRIPMDRGVWLATVHGVAELDTTEQLITATHERKNISFCRVL